MASEKVLDGQVAVVTGGGHGIGAAIARKLAALGANIVICGRTAGPLRDTSARIREAGGQCEAIPCDITDLRGVESLASDVDQRFGRIDILVNNAGVGVFGKPLLELSPEEWEQTLNTNLRGVFYCIRAFAPMMVRAKTGHIINISSLASHNPVPKAAAYAASKWGLNGLSYSVAEELRGDNIRVSVVCPGSTVSDLNMHSKGDQSKMLKGEDVAYVVAMLVTQTPQSFVSEVLIRPTQKP
jgi:3-oxoacyl-[acyl-carrier protein] reductase